MKIRFVQRLGMLALFAGLSLFAHSQPNAPVIESPEVHPDNKVTFRFMAPHAKEVKLSGQFQKSNVDMTKDDRGVWSVTVGPIKPDMYPYNFVVDGTSVPDPKSAVAFPNEGFKSSLVEITGNTPLVHTVQNIPHGTLSYRSYQSPELGTRP